MKTLDGWAALGFGILCLSAAAVIIVFLWGLTALIWYAGGFR